MFGRVIEHGRANTVFTAGAVQDINIDTTFAAFPESLVLSEVGEGDGLLA